MNTADLVLQDQSETTMVRRRCDIELPSGLKLEAIWTKPIFQPEEEHAVKLAVCLHPWSRLGGNMHDPVLDSLLETLTVVHRFHVLRYNSRGVGESSGSASFTGFAEAEDLQEVVQVAIRESGSVEEVLILGYSHGSLVASLHPILPPPIRTMHVLLSYPLGPRGFLTLFNSRTYQNRLEALLRDSRAQVLVVHGDADNFTGAAAYDKWADGLKAIVKQSLPETDAVVEHDGWVGDRLLVERVAGGTHFWSDAAQRSLSAANKLPNFQRELGTDIVETVTAICNEIVRRIEEFRDVFASTDFPKDE